LEIYVINVYVANIPLLKIHKKCNISLGDDYGL
jgi:hypothetical protein